MKEYNGEKREVPEGDGGQPLPQSQRLLGAL